MFYVSALDEHVPTLLRCYRHVGEMAVFFCIRLSPGDPGWGFSTAPIPGTDSGPSHHSGPVRPPPSAETWSQNFPCSPTKPPETRSIHIGIESAINQKQNVTLTSEACLEISQNRHFLLTQIPLTSGIVNGLLALTGAWLFLFKCIGKFLNFPKILTRPSFLLERSRDRRRLELMAFQYGALP